MREYVEQAIVIGLAVALGFIMGQRTACANPLTADEFWQWEKTTEVENPYIVVEQATKQEMRDYYLEHGYKLKPNQIVLGLSELWYSETQDRWICIIRVHDTSDWETVAHETRHCNGWSHQDPTET